MNRYTTNNGGVTHGTQQYFTSQQHQIQPKYELRTNKNVPSSTHRFHFFIYSFISLFQSNTNAQNGTRLSRYQQALRSSENNPQHNNPNRAILPTHIMPQITSNFSPKTAVTTSNPSLDSSVRTKSANTVPRHRAGLFS